jgi:hypothetical protein
MNPLKANIAHPSPSLQPEGSGYRFDNSQPLDPVLHQMDPVDAHSLLTSILILLSFLPLGSISGLFPSGIQTKMSYGNYLSPKSATHHILDLVTLIISLLLEE